jgi:hypothetical protein
MTERTLSELITALEARGLLHGDWLPSPQREQLPCWGYETIEGRRVVWIQVPTGGAPTTIWIWPDRRGNLQRWEIWDHDVDELYSADGWPGFDAALTRARLIWQHA